MSTDQYAIACNFAVSRPEARKGAKAFIDQLDTGGGSTEVFVRSRGHRWVHIWVRTHQLTNFRVATIPPEHPLVDRLIYCRADRHSVQMTVEILTRETEPSAPDHT